MVKTQVICAGGSDAGRIRRNNEDAWHADADRGIFLVVDGIGGQSAGEKAAEIALERVRARLERQTGTTEERIREAITVANNEIAQAARSNPEWSGMACVLTVVVLENGSAVVGHVGDSRLYQIRGQKIRKITHDHSPVGEREDKQELSEAEAMRHPRRNEVFRDVGSDPHSPDDEGFIEVQRFAFEPDSALVLCSDGLSDQVTSAVIRHTVERNAQDPGTAVRELIEAANKQGGKDNVTVIVVEGPEFTAPAPVEAAGGRTGRGWALSMGVLLTAMALSGLGARYFWPRNVPVPVARDPRAITVAAGQSIQAALAEARPGDTVDVSPGEYFEEVRLKDGVTLRSRPPREAILRGAVVADGVKDARITGFIIRPDQQAPLRTAILLENSAVEVDDTDVSGAAVCVEIRGSVNPSIRSNTIHDCTEYGLLIAGPSTPWISHNLIQRNKIEGVVLRDGARPSFVDNVLERNGPPSRGKKK